MLRSGLLSASVLLALALGASAARAGDEEEELVRKLIDAVMRSAEQEEERKLDRTPPAVALSSDVGDLQRPMRDAQGRWLVMLNGSVIRLDGAIRLEPR